MVEKTLALWRVETAKYVPLTNCRSAKRSNFSTEGHTYPRQDSNLCSRLRRPVLYPTELRGLDLSAIIYGAKSTGGFSGSSSKRRPGQEGREKGNYIKLVKALL